jgi:hypothetical protein
MAMLRLYKVLHMSCNCRSANGIPFCRCRALCYTLLRSLQLYGDVISYSDNPSNKNS